MKKSQLVKGAGAGGGGGGDHVRQIEHNTKVRTQKKSGNPRLVSLNDYVVFSGRKF